jgi:hypothetical protein
VHVGPLPTVDFFAAGRGENRVTKRPNGTLGRVQDQEPGQERGCN